jgi:predicted nucleotidyltransferase
MFYANNKKNRSFVNTIVFICATVIFAAQTMGQITVSPSRNANNISAATNITVTFGSQMNSTTYAGNVYVVGIQSGIHTGAFSNVSATSFTFNPDSNFTTGEVVNVTLGKNILEDDGDSLTNGYTWHFTIEVTKGNGEFIQTSFDSLGHGVNYLANGDFDNDGDIDIAAVSSSDNLIMIMRNDGSENFVVSSTINVGTDPYGIIARDFNNDGYLDLANTDRGNNEFRISLNDGAGNFLPSATYPTGSDPIQIGGADFDGDGFCDIVTSHFNSFNIYIYFGEGDGTFGNAYTPPQGTGGVARAYGLATADYDNDGDVDIVLSTHAHNTIFYRNNGNRTFTRVQTYPTKRYASSIAAADLNNDGYIDFVTGDEFSDSLSLLLNNGDGTFTLDTSLNSGGKSHAVVLADYDNDGDIDIAVTHMTLDKITILYNNGNATFSNPFTITTGDAPISLTGADFDGDGDIDLMTTSSAKSTYFLRNAPLITLTALSPANESVDNATTGSISGTFSYTMKQSSLTTSNIIVHGSLSGKINGTITSTTSNSFTFVPSAELQRGEKIFVTLTQNILTASDDSLFGGYSWNFTTRTIGGKGTFTLDTTFSSGGTKPTSIVSGDFNKDGYLDLAVANQGSNTVVIFKYDIPAKKFKRDAILFVGTNPQSITASDLNNDGFLDIVTANSGDTTISILGNDGSGNFSLVASVGVTTPAGTDPYAVIATDVDNDGDNDLIVSLYLSSLISVVRNDGAFSFTRIKTQSTGSLPVAIAAADFDADGLIDLGVLSLLNDKISRMKNVRKGNFQEVGTLITGSRPYSLVTADFDNNGFVDFATVRSNENNVKLIFNNGNSTYRSDSNYIDVGKIPRYIGATDVDGDGAIDIICANSNSDNISVLKNDGSGHFTQLNTIDVGSEPSYIAFGDYDNDRDVDMAIVNTNANTVSIVRNDDFISVSGKIYRDFNGDSSIVGENTLKNWVVKVYSNSILQEQKKSDLLGAYSFTNLPAGAYTVEESLLVSSWSQTYPKPGNGVTLNVNGTNAGPLAYSVTLSPGVSFTNLDFANKPTDTVFFRTLRAEEGLLVKPAKLKYTKGIPNEPNFGTVLEAEFKRISKVLPIPTMLGIPQTGENTKKYAWVVYKKAAEMGQLYTSPHVFTDTTNKQAFPLDYVRDLNGVNTTSKKLVKVLKPSRKKFNNVALEQGVIFKFNLMASKDSIIPPHFGDKLVLAEPFELAGRELEGKTLAYIGDVLDTIMTYWEINGINTPSARENLYNFSTKILKKINEAFYDSLAPDNYIIDSLGVVSKKNPYAVKLRGVRSAQDVDIVEKLDGKAHESGSQNEPFRFELYQNYPNPFNPTTTLSFVISQSSFVTMKIYNILGQEVTTLLNNEAMEEGLHEVQFDASRFSSGVYFYRLTSTSENKTFVDIKKMVLMK